MEGVGLDTAFWKGRRVFLTGHTGFKGSWLCLWLRRLGAEVVGFALPPPTRPSLFDAARVAEGMRSIEGDVADLDALGAALAAADPEIAIHLAAQALVPESYRDPVGTYRSNVMGTVHLLEATRRRTRTRVVLIATSDKCYENRERPDAYREDARLGGRDPYSSSKACAELVVSAFRDSFFPVERLGTHGVALASTRSGNVLGGGDWASDRLVPDLVRGFLEGKPVRIRRPDAVRPWQHVLDPLRGYLMLAERLWEDPAGFGGPWNFAPAPGDAAPVSWLAEKLAEAWGEGASLELDAAPHPPEATLLRLDATQARERLGWSPWLSLDETLAWLLRWYAAHRDGQDMRAHTEAQIERYECLGGAR